MKIGSAVLLAMMIFFILPSAIHHLKHGRKGSNKEWLNAILLLGGVMLFVLLLMKLV